jgi:hypothetical protein
MRPSLGLKGGSGIRTLKSRCTVLGHNNKNYFVYKDQHFYPINILHTSLFWYGNYYFKQPLLRTNKDYISPPQSYPENLFCKVVMVEGSA